MANEISLSGSLVYTDAESASLTLSWPSPSQRSITTKKFVWDKMSVTFAAEIAIPLGSVATLGWAIFFNRDATNFIELRVATGGTKFAKLWPLTGCGPIYLGSGITAPYALADTGNCQMEFLILNA